jgi:hypothetical protein
MPALFDILAVDQGRCVAEIGVVGITIVRASGNNYLTDLWLLNLGKWDRQCYPSKNPINAAPR